MLFPANHPARLVLKKRNQPNKSHLPLPTRGLPPGRLRRLEVDARYVPPLKLSLPPPYLLDPGAGAAYNPEPVRVISELKYRRRRDAFEDGRLRFRCRHLANSTHCLSIM